MHNRSEFFFTGHQDIRLFAQLWENPQAQGTIIFTHGHGEHSESYHRLTKAFENDFWNFYGWDLRGHGRSEGHRGYASEFDDYCYDYKIFLDLLMNEKKIQNGPIVLLCHSMGALIQIKTLLRNPDIKYDALIVSAPLFGLAVKVPAWKSNGAFFINKILPQVTLDNELKNNMLTSDSDVIREYEQDSLRHTRMSPGVFLGMQESIIYVHHRANELKRPALFLLPEKDPVCNTPDAKAFFNKISSTKKEMFIYANAKHELFNDVMRSTVFADLKKFLDSVRTNNTESAK